MSKHTRLHTSTRPEAQWLGGIHFPAVRQRPRMFILENVRNLQVRGLPDVLHALRRCGYKVACMLQTPLGFRVTQHRQRLYLLGFRNDVLRQDVTDDDLQHFLDGFYVRLSRGHCQCDINDFLCAENHPFVVATREQTLRKVMASKVSVTTAHASGAAKWIGKHKRLRLTTSRLDWTDAMTASAPQYPLLPIRIRELMDAGGMQFPSATARLVDYSQTTAQEGVGHYPCIVPKGQIWIGPETV